jgi:hypothetical protein
METNFFKKTFLSPSGCLSEPAKFLGEMMNKIAKLIRATLTRIRPQICSRAHSPRQSEFEFGPSTISDFSEPTPHLKIHLNLGEKDASRVLASLEAAFAKAPEELIIELIGPGFLLHDNALMLFEEIRNRPPRTRLHVRARTCLIDGAILLWLAGDTRSMRCDGWLQLSALPSSVDISSETLHSGSLLIQDEEPATTDLRSIFRYIGEWLPVHEMAGRRIFERELRDFGLLDDEESQEQLTALFHAESVPHDFKKARPREDPAASSSATWKDDE